MIVPVHSSGIRETGDILRRDFVTSTLAITAGSFSLPASVTAAQPVQRSQLAVEDVMAELNGAVLPGVAAVITRTLRQDPESLNTNWNGSFQVEALLHWAARGLESQPMVTLGKYGRSNFLVASCQYLIDFSIIY